jgi:signal transduction histidine kinase
MDAARRIEAVRGVAEPGRGQQAAVHVDDLLRASLAMLKNLVQESGVTVRMVLPETLPAVKGDPKQLEIVFINLIKNAIEAMDGDSAPTLSLSATEQPNHVIISVKDTGTGIAEKDRPHVFEPHYSTKGRKGTGMGLFLAHQIVKAHEGTIEIRSKVGSETEFLIALPKYTESVAA